MSGYNLKDSKKNTKVRELLGLEPVSLSRSRLKWFGHLEYKDDRLGEAMYVDEDWENSTEGTSKEDLVGCVKVDVASFGLSHEDAQDRDQWRLKIRGETS